MMLAPHHRGLCTCALGTLLLCCVLAALVAAPTALFVAFHNYSFWIIHAGRHSSASGFRISPAQRLLFCSIEKNANSAFSDLLCSMNHAGGAGTTSWWQRLAARVRTTDDFELGCTWVSANAHNVGMSDDAVWRAFRHETHDRWLSAVFVRDPLERFLSGYLSKCTPHHDPDRYICKRIFGARNASFVHAVGVMAHAGATGRDLPAGTPGDHFRRQSSFCNGAVGSGGFDAMYVLHRSTSRRDVLEMLRRVGITDASAAVPSFEHHFPPPGETLSSPYKGGDHTTGAAHDLANYRSLRRSLAERICCSALCLIDS